MTRLTYAESRWPGDPYPAALEAFQQSAEREAQAWERVAQEATCEANAARSVRAQYRGGARLPALIEEATALVAPTRALHVAALRAEDTRPPATL